MAIDGKTRELIAVGASITANCQPCLQYHSAKAREAGADDADISAAIEVGKLVRKGAAAKMDGYAASVQCAPPCSAGAKAAGCCG